MSAARIYRFLAWLFVAIGVVWWGPIPNPENVFILAFLLYVLGNVVEQRDPKKALWLAPHVFEHRV